MSKHTPGKWVIDMKNDGINYNGKMMDNFTCSIKSEPDLDGNEWFIALVHSGAGWNSLEDETETMANAKLIAAAPDLLEAVIGLLYGNKLNIMFDSQDEQHKYNQAIRNAKAAIAKATD